MKMEINHLRIGKGEQIVCNLEEQDAEDQVRAYTCAFCKRGFSNAQALGGHMNIHRKERAKLKQGEDESLLSVDITKRNPFIHSQASADELFQLEPTEDKGCTLGRPLTLSGEGDAIEELQHRPFFSEKPSKSNDQKAWCFPGGHVEKTLQIHGSSQKELDLELRLGLEPTP